MNLIQAYALYQDKEDEGENEKSGCCNRWTMVSECIFQIIIMVSCTSFTSVQLAKIDEINREYTMVMAADTLLDIMTDGL